MKESLISRDGASDEKAVEVQVAPVLKGNFSPTPLPKAQLYAAMLLLFSEGFSACVVFPFLPFMIRSFNLSSDENVVGYYAGLVASCFFFCQFLSSFAWGYLADKIGRRPVLMFGVLGNVVFGVLFGLSGSLFQAILFRSLNGLTNGNFGVIKVYLRDISDATNQVQAFGMFGMTWGIAQLVGPMMGGFLTDPSHHMSALFSNSADSIWFKYPFLLPCLTSSFISLISYIISWIYLLESIPSKKVMAFVQANKETLVAARHSVESMYGSSAIFTQSLHDDMQAPNLSIHASSGPAKPSVWTVFTGRLIGSNVIMASLLVFTASSFAETFSVWAATAKPLGLGFNSIRISFCAMAQGVSLVIMNKFFIRKMIAKLTARVTFLIGMVLGVVAQYPPFLTGLNNHTENAGYFEAFWVLLIVSFVLRGVHQAMCFTTQSILLNNCITDPTMLGAINGLAASAAAFTRSFAPVSGTSLMAYTLSVNGDSIFSDYHLVFLVIAAFCAIAALIAYSLPAAANTRA